MSMTSFIARVVPNTRFPKEGIGQLHAPVNGKASLTKRVRMEIVWYRYTQIRKRACILSGQVRGLTSA